MDIVTKAIRRNPTSFAIWIEKMIPIDEAKDQIGKITFASETFSSRWFSWLNLR